MIDIIERLRVAAVLVEGSDDLSLSGTPNVCRDAADEIERLRAAIRKYLSHQLSHQESYVVLRAALDEQVAQ